jgi:hypothetical protein
MNLRPQQVQSFQLSPRISALEARPFEKSWGGKFDSIQTKWGYDAQPGDRLQVQWYRDGQKYGDLHSVETLPQNVSPQLPRSSAALRSSPSRLLPSSNIFDALDDDRQGMGFYAPQMGAFTAFPGLKKVFPELETPPLESGTYKVEIYLNGTLEGTKEVVLP